jgi:hypothetical protein
VWPALGGMLDRRTSPSWVPSACPVGEYSRLSVTNDHALTKMTEMCSLTALEATCA